MRPRELEKGENAHANVLGVPVGAVDMSRALESIAEHLHSGKKGYVCAAGVHGVMEAQRNQELCGVYQRAFLTVPDGMPLVWVGRLQGHAGMERVTGPDLMVRIFAEPRFSGLRHFFYGGEPGVAAELQARMQGKFPRARIVGTYTPPFRDLNSDEEAAFLTRISQLKPDLIWVGIGCPRQEIFMARYLGRLETRLVFGVGAAFDYHTGRIRDCAPWIKQAGLQWLHRLMQDPRRLWRRYLRNNPAFVWRILVQIICHRLTPSGRADGSSGRDASASRAPKKATQC